MTRKTRTGFNGRAMRRGEFAAKIAKLPELAHSQAVAAVEERFIDATFVMAKGVLSIPRAERLQVVTAPPARSPRALLRR